MSRRFLALPLAAFLVSAPAASSFELTTTEHAQSAASDQSWCDDTDNWGGRDRESSCEVRELSDASAARLIANSSNGSISVTGSSRRGISVQARIVASAPSRSEARDLVRDVNVTLDAGRVRAEGPRSARNRSWSVSYRVEVPSSFDVSLDTSNGSVSVQGVKGRIDAESSNGSLRLTDVGGQVEATTSNGSVHVSLSGTKWDGEGLRVVTSNGSARVDLPEGYNARLIAGTSNGRMTLDVPVMVQGNISKRIDATIGSGGPTIEVRTSNGSLRVGRR